jgi:hypothetical protein
LRIREIVDRLLGDAQSPCNFQDALGATIAMLDLIPS